NRGYGQAAVILTLVILFLERAMSLLQYLKAGGAAALVLMGFLVAVSRAETLSPAAQRGRVFVRANCAKCHAIGPIGDSPLALAPASARCTSAIRSSRCRRRWPRASSPDIPRCRSSACLPTR